jgi:allantoicase
VTVESFKPYGDVIQGFDLDTSAPKGIDVSIANQGTAFKFHRMAKVEETYPAGALKRGGIAIGVARQYGLYDTAKGAEITVATLER